MVSRLIHCAEQIRNNYLDGMEQEHWTEWVQNGHQFGKLKWISTECQSYVLLDFHSRIRMWPEVEGRKETDSPMTLQLPVFSRILYPLLLLGILQIVGCQKREKELPTIVQETKPSVVEVLAYNEGDTLISTGTGFFVSPNEIITNRHVVAYATKAKIRLATGSEYAVTYVTASSDFLDIIRLGVDVRDERIKGLTLSKEHPNEGERVVVVGNPLGLESTISDGLVSSVRSANGRAGLIQISAPISPGSSGSPVLNMFGQVIGIATMQIKEGQNLNFALPSQLIDSLQTMNVIPFADWRTVTLRWKSRVSPEMRIRMASISEATEWQAEPVKGTDKLRLTKWRESHFDRVGNQVRYVQYGGNGSIAWKTETIYNDDGRKVGWEFFDTDGVMQSRDSISYPNEFHSEAFTWNSLGQLVNKQDEFKHHPTNQGVDSTIEWDFLTGTIGTKKTVFDSLGNVVIDSGFSVYTTTYSYYYNQRGWKIQETERKYDNDELQSETLRNFDSFERLTHKRLSLKKDGYSVEFWYSYDNNGNQVSEIKLTENLGGPSMKKFRKFDEFGNLSNEDTFIRFNNLGESEFHFFERRVMSYEYYK